METRVGRSSDQHNVRFPDGLRARIKAAAKANRRSMNSEIIFHLERAFPAPEAATGERFGDMTPAAASINQAVGEPR